MQHPNVMIDGSGHIKLVDYDSFYIPSLAIPPRAEFGHDDQHPEHLKTGYYAVNADAFSALIIYRSLLALAGDRGL